ncbi:flagellar protein FlaG [Sporolactobacillus sp. THM19-2]|uniref:flagellar protein FlaG n=1 Tax=Sporolactobacillus sp. THM19-2 TaxID=2511171 RepID=UPI001F0D4176|nr:flagellar protein FlaG [Sporolactobacillus sp. THM19-2]
MGIDVAGSASVTHHQKVQIAMPDMVDSRAIAEDKNSVSKPDEERIYTSFTKKQLDDLVKDANKLLSSNITEMRYVLHDKLNTYYIRLEDAVTHEVIREIPPKKFMDMYAAIAEKLGLIVNKRV